MFPENLYLFLIYLQFFLKMKVSLLTTNIGSTIKYKRGVGIVYIHP
jgi:hypothetical protein